MSLLLLKALHLIAMVCWFAGLFYLPRLFVYHAMSEDQASRERFHIMERKLYRGIMTPAMLATLLFGSGMLLQQPAYLHATWMQVKLALVLCLVIYHHACGVYIHKLQNNTHAHSHVYFRWFNEVPVIFLVAIILLAVFRPV
jgi:putative membrane protein